MTTTASSLDSLTAKDQEIITNHIKLESLIPDQTIAEVHQIHGGVWKKESILVGIYKGCRKSKTGQGYLVFDFSSREKNVEIEINRRLTRLQVLSVLDLCYRVNRDSM